MRVLVVIICSFFVVSCASRKVKPIEVDETVEIIDREVPGTVHSPYFEPIIDVVKVPPHLDPEGIYFRPSHTNIYEIRQGRVQGVEYPKDDEDVKAK